MKIKGIGNPFESAKKAVEKSVESLEKPFKSADKSPGKAVSGKAVDYVLKAARAARIEVSELPGAGTANALRRMEIKREMALHKLGVQDWWNRGDTIWQKESHALQFAEVFEKA